MSIDAMSVKELKAAIQQAGMSAVGVTEKSELKEIAAKAVEKLEAEAKSGFKVGGSDVTLGGWECRVINPTSTPKHVIVTLHGFGATNTDFVPLASHLKHTLPENVMWVFPQANVDRSLGASAWWKIDVPEWMSAQTGGEKVLANLIRKTHEGLPECRANGLKMVKEIMTKTGLSSDKIHLSGFSQGAMTSMDIALSHDTPLGSVAMISGAPIVVDEWKEKLEKNKGKHNFFVSHGKSDPVLPYAASGWAVKLFEESGGTEVTYVPHAGGHDLGGPSVILALGKFWAAACN